MKFSFLFGLVMLPVLAKSQPCALLTQTFAVADSIKKDSKELYVFRFSEKQLDDIRSLPGLEKPVDAIKKLQKTLDEDNASLKNGILWQLDMKLAEKQFAELNMECTETGFQVYRREIDYYKSRFLEKKPEKK
jgi:hypothetical protein